MPVKSLNDSRYMLINAYSKYVYFVHIFLINKHEAIGRFKEYMNRYECMLNKRIIPIKSNNGRRFINIKFQALLRSKGIRYEKTVPYNPESNEQNRVR